MNRNDSRSIENFRKMPASQRRQVNLVPKRKYAVNKRFLDKDTLLAWAKENDITSKVKLRKVSKRGDPNEGTFKKVFGSWQAYREEAGLGPYHKPTYKPMFQEPPHDLDYLIRLVVECDLWFKKDWIQKHKEYPDVVPSVGVVFRECGSWQNLKVLAMSESLRLTLRQYLVLRRKLNRYPHKHECEKEGIDITPWIKKFKSKRILDGIIDEMEKAEENALRRRSEEQGG